MSTVNIAFFSVMASIFISGCNLSTSIRKMEKVASGVSSGLSWSQATPYKLTNVNASWVVSTTSGLANQKIQFYSGTNCNSTTGALIDLASSSISTAPFTGVDGNTYTYKITSINSKGVATVSACSDPMVIDTTAPSIAVTSAAAWINIANKSAYVVAGTCTDSTSGISGNVMVSVSDGSGVNTATGACVSGAFSISVNTTTSALAGGTNNITVSAQVSDAATNIGTASITRSLDITAPALAISTAPTWINDANKAAYVVTGTCSDAISGISGNVSVSLTDGTNTATATGACGAGTFSISVDATSATPGALAEGSANISISAAATDVAGNAGSSSSVTRSKDVTHPTLTLTSASIPAWVNNSNKTAYPIVGTCSDATSGLTAQNVSVVITDGTNSKTVTATCAAFTAGLSVNMTTGFTPAASLVDGTSNISITASIADVATNSTTTATLTRSKDTVNPTITSITANSADGTYITGATLGFTITFSEAVTVTGASFTLNTVSSTGTATCTNSSNSTTMLCSYTAVDGEGSPDLDYASTTALTVTSFKDAANNTGVTTLAAPGAAGSISIGSALNVNPPELQWEEVAGTALAGTFNYGSTLSADTDQTFILHNYRRGQTTSTLAAAVLSGADATKYQIVTDNCSGTTLTYNSSCTVIVRFKAGTLLESTYTATMTTSAVVGGSAVVNMTGTVVCPGAGGKTSYTSGTTGVTYTVPGGCVKIAAKLWGAGGSSGNNNTGGAGAYVAGTKTVSPGDSVTVQVGGGGGMWSGAGINGGGDGYGGGGGYSAILLGATHYLIAGGGGAGIFSWVSGGAAGGTTGSAGLSQTSGRQGLGASSVAGGSGTTAVTTTCAAAGFVGNVNGSAGSYLQGGEGGMCSGNQGGGGGGGGYYGGGGGGGTAVSDMNDIGGGGGGSSFIHGSVTSTTMTAGAGPVPGNSADADRGTGGDAGNASGGFDGSVVITPSN